MILNKSLQRTGWSCLFACRTIESIVDNKNGKTWMLTSSINLNKKTINKTAAPCIRNKRILSLTALIVSAASGCAPGSARMIASAVSRKTPKESAIEKKKSAKNPISEVFFSFFFFWSAEKTKKISRQKRTREIIQRNFEVVRDDFFTQWVRL